jgi:hypothetical protein
MRTIVIECDVITYQYFLSLSSVNYSPMTRCLGTYKHQPFGFDGYLMNMEGLMT